MVLSALLMLVVVLEMLAVLMLVGLIGEWKLCNQFLIPQVLILLFLLSV